MVAGCHTFGTQIFCGQEKGDKYECSNPRGINLLCVVGKLYGRVLIKIVMDRTECAIEEKQCGFRHGRGCMNQVFRNGRGCMNQVFVMSSAVISAATFLLAP